MPRFRVPPDAVAPITSLAPPLPPSPIVAKLRTDWRWAAISQFIWTFSDAFGLVDWDIENLERDLDGDEQALLPQLLAKLLFVLTYNRQINRDNVFDNLRKTYLKRNPETGSTPLGTLEEPIEWATLGLSLKVQILHELCEWQLDNPGRFRALLKTQDEEATWRVEPLGWDKVGNTYYLFDDNRLWVQRIPPAPPRPPKKTSLKAKRAERAIRRSKPPPKKSHKKKDVAVSAPAPASKKEEEDVSGPRRRTQVNFYGNLTPTVAALKRGASNVTPTSSRGTRSSGRLQPGSAPVIETPSKARNTPLPLGTRVSRRLRNVDDEWQQVPDEWLSPQKEDASIKFETPDQAKGSGKRKTNTRRRDLEEESELSDLTDEEEHQARLSAIRKDLPEEKPNNGVDEDSDEALTPAPEEDTASAARSEALSNSPPTQDEVEDRESAKEEEDDEDEVKSEEDETKANGDESPQYDDEEEKAKVEEEESMDEVKLAVKKANELPEGFVEWEAVCVTLYEWRTFPDQFAKSRDPDERALYKMLQEVGPTIIEGLVAKEQELLKQAAVLNRKRSSRIATKELEKEEEARIAKAQKDMEDRMSAQQREEERIAREEADVVAREKSREDRLREREERAAARIEAAQQKIIDEQEEEERAALARADRKRRREMGDTISGSNTPKPSGDAERWELACEVCQKNGWNIDGDDDLVCCDDCGRWQHTECHDRQDAQQGRPKRNWDKVDFQCQDCRRKAARKRQRVESAPQDSVNGSAQVVPPQSNGASQADQRVPHMLVPPPMPHQPLASGQSASSAPKAAPRQPYPSHPPQPPQMHHTSSHGSNGHARSSIPPYQVPHGQPQSSPHGRAPQQQPSPRDSRPILPPIHQAMEFSNGSSHVQRSPNPPPHRLQAQHQSYPSHQMPPHHYPPQPQPYPPYQHAPQHGAPPHPQQHAPRMVQYPGQALPPPEYQYHPGQAYPHQQYHATPHTVQHHPPPHSQQWQPQPYQPGPPGHLQHGNGPPAPPLAAFQHDRPLNGHHVAAPSRGPVKTHEHVQQ